MLITVMLLAFGCTSAPKSAVSEPSGPIKTIPQETPQEEFIKIKISGNPSFTSEIFLQKEYAGIVPFLGEPAFHISSNETDKNIFLLESTKRVTNGTHNSERSNWFEMPVTLKLGDVYYDRAEYSNDGFTLKISEFGEVGQYIKGSFNGTLVKRYDKSAIPQSIIVEGEFIVKRDPNRK